jgi:hypothetical protein
MSDFDWSFTPAEFQLLDDALERAELAGMLGECKDYTDEDGFCSMCTALQKFENLRPE